jgi:hypothetical protein
MSHEGCIVWAISAEDYYENKDLFKFSSKSDIEVKMEKAEAENTYNICCQVENRKHISHYHLMVMAVMRM